MSKDTVKIFDRNYAAGFSDNLKFFSSLDTGSIVNNKELETPLPFKKKKKNPKLLNCDFNPSAKWRDMPNFSFLPAIYIIQNISFNSFPVDMEIRSSCVFIGKVWPITLTWVTF